MTAFFVLGKTSINELSELLEHDFSSENDDYDTLGGFILNYAGKFRLRDSILHTTKYKFTVKDVIKSVLQKFWLKKISSTDI